MSSQSSPAALRPSVLFRDPPSPPTAISGRAPLQDSEHPSRRSEGKHQTSNEGKIPLARSISIASTSSLDPLSQDDDNVDLRDSVSSVDRSSRIDGSGSASSTAPTSSAAGDSAARTSFAAAACQTNATHRAQCEQPPHDPTGSSNERLAADSSATASASLNDSRSPPTAALIQQRHPEPSSATRASTSSAASSNLTKEAPNVAKRKLKRKSPPSHSTAQSLESERATWRL